MVVITDWRTVIKLTKYYIMLNLRKNDITFLYHFCTVTESLIFQRQTNQKESLRDKTEEKYLKPYNKRVIALISVNIVPRCDIYGLSQARVLWYPNSGQDSPISVQ